MPQIIFSDEERAEIERLVAEHSPSNHPHIAPTLKLLQPNVRAEFVAEYETMLRVVTETAFAVLESLENVDDELLESIQDMLLIVDNTCLGGRSTDEILATLDVQGDSKLSEACFLLSLNLIGEILSNPRLARVPVAS